MTRPLAHVSLAACMWSFFLVVSIFPIAIALAIRWWFGLRVLALHGEMPCKLAAGRWQETLGEPLANEQIPASAGQVGQELRAAALALWKTHDPKTWKARRSARNFGLAVPPLTIMVAVFAYLVAKVPITGALAAVAAAIAISCVFGLLSLGAELRALSFTIQRVRKSRLFPRADDEDAAIQCAVAHSWSDTLPPILKVLQPAAVKVLKSRI